MNKYEDPTQRLTSHNWSEEYKENYEKIFGKKETWLERRDREAKEKEIYNSIRDELLKPLTDKCQEVIKKHDSSSN